MPLSIQVSRRFNQINKLIKDDKELLKEVYFYKRDIDKILKLNRKIYNEVSIETLEDLYLARFK